MPRQALTAALLAFVAVSIVWAYAAPSRSSDPSPQAGDHVAADLVVWYLHGARRCVTCESIESGARRALMGGFADELESGAIVFETRNTEQPENAHFVKEFGLVASSLVVATPDGASFRVLERVWGLVGDDAAFDAYVTTAVRDARQGRW